MMLRSKTKNNYLTLRKKLSLFLVFFLALGFGILRINRSDSVTPKPTVPVVSTNPRTASETTQSASVDEQPSYSGGVASSTPAKPKDTHGSSILQSGDYTQHRYQALQTPNDSLYSGSWYHQKIQTNRAWDLTTGSSSTVIAVIDTGFALNHQDLTDKWYTNTGEQGQTSSSDHCWTGTPADKATNNCDDDQNGYVDDWRGWDFNTDDNYPQTGMTDNQGAGTQHATMVSGLIAATANNAVGNAGIDWQAKIMPLQVLGDDGTGYTSGIVTAIEYAVNNGANVINMSLGGPDFDQALLDAVDYAAAHNVLVVAASGNCGDTSANECATMVAPGRMSYPAKYPSVLSVGATTSTDDRASFSSYGPELDIVAPGSAVGPLASWSSTITTNGYVSSANGTSFASPIVAGVAGLVRAKLGNPSVEQLESVLLDSADKVSGLSGQNRNDTYGFGRVNAQKAVLMAQALATPPAAVGSVGIQSRQPAKGGLVRSTSGAVQSDEWLLTVCRVAQGDVCSISARNGSTVQNPSMTNSEKGAEIYYSFISGADLLAGTSTISVNSRNYATKVVDVTK